MRSASRKVAYWLVVAGLLIIGGWSVPDPSSRLEQPWREVIPPWLYANWLALACFVLAAVLIIIWPVVWFMDRRHKVDLQKQIRTNLLPGSFRETDAADVLRYVLNESAWGWRTYARVNYWGIVDGLHLREFANAAWRGDIVTVGFGSRENSTVVVDRRCWKDGRIEERTSTIQGGVTMEIRKPWEMITYSQLAVATVDIRQTWPRASILHRMQASAWVWFKQTIWFGSWLSNWIDAWRRAKLKQ